tara:strand:- start:21 stop:296 length:276 start_codon:yes stop_codon:yes gene_type:complete
MDVKKIIIEHFKDKVDEKVLKPIIDDLIMRQYLHDCMFFKRWECYRENIYKLIEIKLNSMKQKNNKKLVFSRCFYLICNDKDILEKICDNI